MSLCGVAKCAAHVENTGTSYLVTMCWSVTALVELLYGLYFSLKASLQDKVQDQAYSRSPASPTGAITLSSRHLMLIVLCRPKSLRIVPAWPQRSTSATAWGLQREEDSRPICHRRSASMRLAALLRLVFSLREQQGE
jgi:hypothetical protein